MQKTKAELPVLIIGISVIGACFLRLFQLLRIPDVSADTAVQYTRLTYFIYAALGAVFAASLVIGAGKPVKHTLHYESRSVAAASLAAAAGMFIDFVNKSYSCYVYFSNTRYVEYGYSIPLVLSGALALICCFYLICISFTARGRNLDFRKLNLFHLSVILFGVARLITITTAIVDVRLDVDSSLEFLCLIFIVLMWFGQLSFLDGSGRSRPFIFTVSSIMSICTAAVFLIPHLLCVFVHPAGAPDAAAVSAVTYMTMGIFAVSLLAENKS